MTDMNKNEQQIAETMNEYHWRAWLSVDELAKQMGKRASNLDTALCAMAKRRLVERKPTDDGNCFRLTPTGRAKIAA